MPVFFSQTPSEALETLTKIFGNTLFACALKPMRNLLTEWSPLTFSCNPAFYKLLSIISFLNILWNYGGKVLLKRLLLNSRTYTQIHTPTEAKGEGGGGRGGDGTPR